MEQVADHVGMNVATISRVANDKFVQTPHGVFEIKYFFNAGVPQESGEDLSKRMVKEKIETLIRAESPEKPLSDQEIFQRLNAEGIQIARRTVSKYREELKIRPARFRKRIASES
jgi:RNA polymerase sigma-54 factor